MACFYVVMFSCILFTKHEHVPYFLSIFSTRIFLLVTNKASYLLKEVVKSVKSKFKITFLLFGDSVRHAIVNKSNSLRKT
jgi:hypothetical protein